VLQAALEAEMAHHLGYDKNDPAGRNGENSRNGYGSKTVTTEIGRRVRRHMGFRRNLRANDQEKAVVAAFLHGSDDERAEPLLRQFSEARRVRRRVSGSTFEVSPESTTEDLLVDLDRDVESETVELRDADTGRLLSFTLTLKRGGFLGSLKGRVEGTWPSNWAVNHDEARRKAPGALTFDPEPAEVAEPLAHLIGVPIDAMRNVRVRRGPRPGDFSQLEQREGAHLPSEVREVLEVSNGMRFGGLSVLGTADVYLVELGDGVERWLVGQGDGESQYLCDIANSVTMLPRPIADLGAVTRVAASYRAWLRSEILRASGT